MSNNIYVSSASWTAVAAWATGNAYVSTSNGGRGDYVRQLAAPAVGSERVFRCTTSGTSHATTEPTWVTTKNATTNDNTVTWTECTGQEADQVGGWTAPHARMVAAVVATWSAAGDTYEVGDNHAATQAANLTIALPGTLASPNRVLCVSHLGSIPPVAADLTTGASETTTGAFNVTVTGCASDWEGLDVHCSNTGVNTLSLGGAAQTDLRMKNCNFSSPSASIVTLAIGSSSNSIGCKVVWDNCTYSPGAATHGLSIINGAEFTWKNTAAPLPGTIPTNLFLNSSQMAGKVTLRNMGLTALTTKTMIAAQAKGAEFWIIDCKYPASWTLAATPTSPQCRIFEVRSSASADAYRFGKHDAYGDEMTETTIIRTGGVQVNGTGVSQKAIGSANAHAGAPFEMNPLIATNTVTGADVTVTVYGIWTNGLLPNNDQVWMDVAYLGDATAPVGTRKSGTVATVLTAGSAQASDGSTWGGSTTAFKLVAVLTSPQPALAGEIIATVKCATTNAVYIDPVVHLS